MVQLPPHLCFLSLLILFDTTSRIMGGCTNQRLAPPSGNLTPPRISPSCPHCLRLWLDSEYRLVVSLRNSLPKLLWAGWGPLVTFLGRLLCGASAQVSLRAPAASLFPLVRGHQPTLLAAGYDPPVRAAFVNVHGILNVPLYLFLYTKRPLS